MIDSKIKAYLDRLAESPKRPSSYIFAGADIDGKFAGAKAMAGKEGAAFYFVSKIAKKDGDAEFWERARSKNHPDVLVVEPEVEERRGKTRERQIGVAQVREMLDRIKFFPYELKTKFCIIKKAHKMNREAANALLKSLEEPSESAIFLLLAENLESILPTIISRCAVLRFPQTRLPTWSEENRERFKCIFREDIFERFDYIEKKSKNKSELVSIFKDWEMIMAESLRKLVTGSEDRRKIKKVVEMAENTREAINRLERTNANARSVGENLMLNIF